MKNAKLQAFIPLFYIVWSDDLLTKKEFATLQSFIDSQDWLSAEEKEFLFSKITITSPPSRQDITNWKNKIEQSIQEQPAVKSIFEIAVALSENDAVIQGLEIVFVKLENDLGILGEEAISNFKTKAKTHTVNSHTETSFDVQKITDILDGAQAPIINKVKAVISRPEFKYETPTDINVYR